MARPRKDTRNLFEALKGLRSSKASAVSPPRHAPRGRSKSNPPSPAAAVRRTYTPCVIQGVRIRSAAQWYNTASGLVHTLPRRSANLGHWTPRLALDFFAVNRQLYEDFERIADRLGKDLDAIAEQVLDQQLAKAGELSGRLPEICSHYQRGFRIRPYYWKHLKDEDNCYMCTFSARERYQHEDAHWLLLSYMGQLMSAADPLDSGGAISLLYILWRVKNMHALIDTCVSKAVDQLIAGEEIELSLQDQLEEMSQDLVSFYSQLSNKLPAIAGTLGKLARALHAHLAVTVVVFRYVILSRLLISELNACEQASESFEAQEPAKALDWSCYRDCRNLYMSYRRKVPLLGVLHTATSSADTESSIRALQAMEIERQTIERETQGEAAEIAAALKHSDGTSLASEHFQHAG